MLPRQVTCLHDRDAIETFLRADTFLNIYQLGDLDDRFWPDTTWCAWTSEGGIEAIAMMYSGLSEPTLLAMGKDGQELLRVGELLRSILHLLPRRFYTHLGLGLAPTLAGEYRMESHGKHLKMALTDPSKLDRLSSSRVVPLTAGNAEELLAFYAEAYSGHAFEACMLPSEDGMPPDGTAQFCGLRDSHGLLCVAGVHVYSKEYTVAALGNIATRPGARRRGHGQTVVASLCRGLLRTVRHIGLNVKADNQAAIACYRKLGFETVGAYEECSAELR
jgi:RimJ/RimL family protein N-acetyltransferase